MTGVSRGQVLEHKGVRFPEVFNGGDLIDGVAISKDGTRYGTIEKGEAQIHEIPSDGVITCDEGREIKIIEAERTQGHNTIISDNQMIVNGAKLPAEFNGGNVAGDVVVSRDQTKVAITRGNGKLLIAPTPESGTLLVNGMEITINRGGGVSVRTDGDFIVDMGAGDIVGAVIGSLGGASFGRTSSVHFSVGSSEASDLNDTFQGIEEVRVDNVNESVRLEVSSGNDVLVSGKIADKVKEKGDSLRLTAFEGVVEVPEATEVRIDSVNGSVTGELASGGRVETVNGSVTLVLKAPVNVRIESAGWNSPDVEGMVTQGKLFVPPEGKADKTLRIETVNGGVSVRYAPEKPESQFTQFL
jgi:hypothetical protein